MNHINTNGIPLKPKGLIKCKNSKKLTKKKKKLWCKIQTDKLSFNLVGSQSKNTDLIPSQVMEWSRLRPNRARPWLLFSLRKVHWNKVLWVYVRYTPREMNYKEGILPHPWFALWAPYPWRGSWAQQQCDGSRPHRLRRGSSPLLGSKG